MPEDQYITTKRTRITRQLFRGYFLRVMHRYLYAAGYRRCSLCEEWRDDVPRSYCKACSKIVHKRHDIKPQPRLTLRCWQCDKACSIAHKRKAAFKFCSKRCRTLFEIDHPPQSGKPCKQCGDNFMPDAPSRNRCIKCRSALPNECPQCHEPVAAGRKFCTHSCGSLWRMEHSVGDNFVDRNFTKTCSQCHQSFVTTCSNRAKCPACCKCEQCGRQFPLGTKSNRRFCNRDCGDRWRKEHPTSPKPRKPVVKTPAQIAFIRALGTASKGIPRPNQRGTNNHQWKGGKRGRPERSLLEYKAWAKTVLKRDGYCCAICGNKKGKEAHHIYPWRDYPDRRYDVTNGITLCADHHHATFSKEEQFFELFTRLVSAKNLVTLTDEDLKRLQPITRECLNCGKTITRVPSRAKTEKRSYCGWPCRKEHENKFPPTYRRGPRVSGKHNRVISDKQLTLF